MQAFALQTVLEQEGHDATVITRDRHIAITLRTLFLSIPKRILKNILGKKTKILYEWVWNREIKLMSIFVDPFINKWIKQDNRILSEIKPEDYDAIVVGSDQIWRPLYIGRTLRARVEDAFLNFTEGWNIKRVAYAASFGTDVWEYSEPDTNKVSSLAQNFDAISVREKSGIDLCNKYLRVSNAMQVLDPTLLLEKECYLKLIENQEKQSSILFNYILDLTEEKDLLVNRIAKEKKLSAVRVGAKIDDWDAPIEERIQPPVERWLSAFRDADFIVTDSFHACVFSIIFGKPFIAIGNVDRGLSRFESLLSMFGLSENLLTSADQYESSRDYAVSGESLELLQSLRASSRSFLRNALL